MNRPALEQYRQLCDKVELKFAEIRGRHEKSFACRMGCHSCCLPGLTVSAVEAANLRDYFREHPEQVTVAKELAKADPHKGTRCALLDADGGCVAYEARPLICRSHGAPVQFKREEEATGKKSAALTVERGTCPLNFTQLDVAKLPPVDVINLDTLNTLLALLNKLAFPGDDSRTELSVDALLKS